MVSTANFVHLFSALKPSWRSSGIFQSGNHKALQRLICSAHLKLNSTPQSLIKMPILVLDWDETITIKDTTSLIAHIAETNCPKELPFSYFTEKYMTSLSDFEKLFRTKYGDIDSIEKEVNFQKQLKNVELESIRRLECHEFFKGVHILKFCEAAKDIELMSHCSKLLRNWNQPVYILSINWCKPLIEKRLSLEGITNVKVLANNLQLDDDITTGKFEAELNIRTGHDKLQMLRQLKADHPGERFIYVGDSHGDILPIVDADIGVLIENGRGIKQLKRIYSEVKELSKCEIHDLLDSSDVFTGSWLQLSSLIRNL